MTTQRGTLRRALAAAALLALTTTAVACSSGASDSDATAESAQAAGDVGRAEDASGGGAVADEDSITSGEKAPGSDGVNRTIVSLRSVIKTGEVSVTNADLDAARSRLDTVLTSLGGTIDSESTEHDRKGRIERSTVVVRVPVDRFDTAMSALQDLGRSRHADTSSRDVTTEVIDVDERVQTLENSLNRLQAYQRDASDIDQLILFEQQITQRESELQSLKAQQSHLRDQTSLSTITLSLSIPDKYVPPPSALEDAGFLAGLKGGWNALTDTVVVVLTVVGAVLPFALVLALIGVPAWVLVRRLLRGRSATALP
ncbi:MAG: DUF4349 domain-containing protein, partial [Nocardioides sp.]